MALASPGTPIANCTYGKVASLLHSSARTSYLLPGAIPCTELQTDERARCTVPVAALPYHIPDSCVTDHPVLQPANLNKVDHHPIKDTAYVIGTPFGNAAHLPFNSLANDLQAIHLTNEVGSSSTTPGS